MQKNEKSTSEKQRREGQAQRPETCGIVMPISAIDGCDAAHWANVLEILGEAVRSAGFEPQLVSSSADIGVIQTRIVQNLYENPIIVCDVSGKNPNVMFELGLRLAFDKPVIIVKDDATSYSFDTSPIEHLEYRRDLRYQNVIEFKQALADKIRATVEKSSADKNYSPFLKHFGRFTVASLDTKEVSSNEYLINKLGEVQDELRELNLRLNRAEPRLSQRAQAESARENILTEAIIAQLIDQSTDIDIEDKNERVVLWGRIRNALEEKGIAPNDARISMAMNKYRNLRNSHQQGKA